MNPSEFEDVQRRLPRAPMPFPYQKDDFALWLLGQAAGSGRLLRDLRRSPYAKLLQRPRVKTVLGRCGSGRVTALDLRRAAVADAPVFTLTWGRWGHTSQKQWSRGYHQMARRGLNLVVQLNLPSDHVRDYTHMVKPCEAHPFLSTSHPVAEDGHLTLAWARIDLDLERREALVEEVQSDWVREARDWLTYGYYLPDAAGDPQKIETYVRYVLAPLAALWDEAMLTAALMVLRDHLRIAKVFYYDYETGHLVKKSQRRRRRATGPRSLYSDLPKTFCFEKTLGGPVFLDRIFETELRDVFRNRDRVFWRLPRSGADLCGA